jgi:hypothetical protein
MLMKTLYLSTLLLLAAVITSAQGASVATPDKIFVGPVSFRLLDSNVRYDGVRADFGDVCIHRDTLVYGGRNYYWSDAHMDGLFVEGGAEPSKVYQPYALALRSGWYKRRGDSEPNNNVWGLSESGGKIWMGTDGLGVLAFDPQRSVWSRYDWQRMARPGLTTYLTFVDERHLFFSNSRGNFVYSLKDDVCAQLAFCPYCSVFVTRSRDGSAYQVETEFLGGKNSYVLSFAVLDREFSQLKRVKHYTAPNNHLHPTRN